MTSSARARERPSKVRAKERASPETRRVLRRLHIRRFRGIRDLILDDLAPVTILTGRNGSGKSTVLEAAFLLCGLSNANLVLSLAAFRGLSVLPGADTPFRVLLPDLENRETARIEGETELHQGAGRLSLEIAGITAAFGAEPTTEPRAQLVGVEFRARSGSGERKGYVKWEPAPVGPNVPVLELGPVRLESAPVIRLESPENPDVLAARYIRPQPHAVLAELHGYLTELVKRRATGQVLKLLRLVAPQVGGIQPLSERGQPTIYVELGGARLFPVQILGGGFVNVLQLASFMCDELSQMLLIDEIEDGLHYSVLPGLAEAMLTFARERRKQFIVATHSRDVLSAFGGVANEAPELVKFVKLFRRNGNVESVRFDAGEWSRIEEIGGEIR